MTCRKPRQPLQRSRRVHPAGSTRGWVRRDRRSASYRAELGRFQDFVRRSGRPVIRSSNAVDFDLLRAFSTRSGAAHGQVIAMTPDHWLARRWRGALIVVRRFLRFAWDQDWLREDLAATLIVPRPRASAPATLDRAELEHLIGSLGASTLQEKRDRAFILMLLSTGASLSDALRLDRDRPQAQRVAAG